MTNHPLTDLEIMALKGIQAREREVQDRYLTPLRADFAKLAKLITERLQLPEGALGTTHSINFETNQVVEAPPAQLQPAAQNGAAQTVSASTESHLAN